MCLIGNITLDRENPCMNWDTLSDLKVRIEWRESKMLVTRIPELTLKLLILKIYIFMTTDLLTKINFWLHKVLKWMDITLLKDHFGKKSKISATLDKSLMLMDYNHLQMKTQEGQRKVLKEISLKFHSTLLFPLIFGKTV